VAAGRSAVPNKVITYSQRKQNMARIITENVCVCLAHGSVRQEEICASLVRPDIS